MLLEGIVLVFPVIGEDRGEAIGETEGDEAAARAFARVLMMGAEARLPAPSDRDGGVGFGCEVSEG